MLNFSREYRPDIDGLRAVAILGVLAFHIDEEWLSGGYVGVDVFFVISGYLITSIIRRDLAAGNFSIVGFFERRIRRICPALFVMLAVLILASSFLLLPGDLEAFAKSVRYTALSISNIHFLKATEDYFGREAENMPLLHTWSLGVEEQFYIVFPFLMMLLHRRVKSGRTILCALGGLAAVSLVAAAIYVTVDTPKAFFLLPFRAWEMLLGALLTWAGTVRTGKIAASAAGALGLLLIASAMLLMDKSTPFPGLMALPPCIGAALVIWAGTEPRALSRRLLAWKPLVGIGLISYSLYLWHWPLVVGAKYFPPVNSRVLLAVGPASVLLGYLSWRFVELPFRRPGLPRKRIFQGWAAASVVLLAFAVITVKGDGFPRRFPAEVSRILDFNKRGPAFPNEARKHYQPEKARTYGAPGVTPEIAVWGDSHVLALLPMLDAMGKETGKSLRHFGMAGVPPVAGVTPVETRDAAKVSAYSFGTLELLINDRSIRTVILHSRWTSYSGILGETKLSPIRPRYHEKAFGSYREMTDYFALQLAWQVTKLLDSGKTVVLVYPVPQTDFHVPDTLAKQFIFHGKADGTIPHTSFFNREGRMFEILDSLGNPKNLLRIKPHEKLLEEGRLRVMDDWQPYFRDDNHLTERGTRCVRSLFESLFSQKR